MVSTLVVKMESWSPIVNTGAKLIAQAKLHLPIDAEVELDTQKTPVEFRAVMKAPEQRVQLLSFHSRPITLTRVWPRTIQVWEEPEEKTIMSEEWNRVNTVRLTHTL